MRSFLSAAVIVAMLGSDAFALFIAWFTLAFFGQGWGQWLVAMISIATGIIVSMLCLRALGRLRRGDFAI